jgi:hypothetical protein
MGDWHYISETMLRNPTPNYQPRVFPKRNYEYPSEMPRPSQTAPDRKVIIQYRVPCSVGPVL